MMDIPTSLRILTSGLPLDPLPGPKSRDPSIPHAPRIQTNLTPSDKALGVKNALRYFPTVHHKTLKPEFTAELEEYGHIYMYRFIPDWIDMRAYPVNNYPCKCIEGAAIMAMIMNNLDHRVAQFPHELVTYGGNGQVFSNWAQFWITMKYLSLLDRDQTLSLYSGHPMALFPSLESSPRLVITNGLMIGNSNAQEDYNRLFALGVTQYGQMTAGSFCYIGPQGIVHGTVLTVLNAIRKYLTGNPGENAVVFLSSGLGGMSGAQAKAAEFIPNLIAVIAEVDKKVIDKRMSQGWVQKMSSDSQEIIDMILKFRDDVRKDNQTYKKGISIAFHGNVVSLWRAFADYYSSTGINLVDLASDQTSCHNVYGGGYIPEVVTLEEAHSLLKNDVEKFKELVDDSLRKHISLVNKLCDAGTKFYDYGNAFLLRCHEVGAEVESLGGYHKFRYPSYVEDIMGDIFSLGFGPFRWVCMSQDMKDLAETDNIALRVMQMILNNKQVNNEDQANQYQDNINWIKSCQQDASLVVGSCARILYSDQLGRVLIAQAFNQGIKEGKLTGPVVISRDHHDVSGTDSPFRETANIRDGSHVTADMATHNFVGTGIRGASWVALHNGGGVGWGQVVNGGFGLVLSGKKEDNERIKTLMSFDVSNGIARRSWSRNKFAKRTIKDAMKADPRLIVTLPYDSQDEDDL